MQKIMVSDTSCLILLEKIGRISLLESLFGKITVTGVIADEFGRPLPDFIEIEDAEDRSTNGYSKSFWMLVKQNN